MLWCSQITLFLTNNYPSIVTFAFQFDVDWVNKTFLDIESIDVSIICIGKLNKYIFVKQSFYIWISIIDFWGILRFAAYLFLFSNYFSSLFLINVFWTAEISSMSDSVNQSFLASSELWMKKEWKQKIEGNQTGYFSLIWLWWLSRKDSRSVSEKPIVLIEPCNLQLKKK